MKVCKAAEHCFRLFHKTNEFTSGITNILHTLIHTTCNQFPTELFDDFGDHLYDEEPLSGHAIPLIKLILKKYFMIRIHHETNTLVDKTG